jgi:hypothetical protein
VFEFIEKQNFNEGIVQQILAEMDGSMIPVVDTAMADDGKTDSRRCRSVRWQEAKLCFARDANKLTPFFYATMGGVERAGDLLYRAALRAGFGAKTNIHGLGDGATWIDDQMKRVFGNQVKYLVDFYHISEYLANAAEHSWTSEKQVWLKKQQEHLKENRHEEVLKGIRQRLPQDWDTNKESRREKEQEIKGDETPVVKCYRYISNRKHNLDYKSAIEKDLPIGSGEIESAHKHVIQKRLKLAGAWWKQITADHMLALRTLRANGDWDSYWQRKAA